jgi:hypothetical protein
METQKQAGYRYCRCRDCLETVVGIEGTFCDECEKAGCPDYQDPRGIMQECLREGAYSGDEEI